MPSLDMSDPNLRPLAEIGDELATLAAHLSAGTARMIELLWDFDLRGGWEGWGSCARWLAWRCSMDRRTAREHVRVARALHALPLIRAAFGRGELSYAKVRALTRVEAPANEERLLELAEELTAIQLERALGACRRVRTIEADRVQRREELTCSWDEDGSLVVRGRLAPEDGALFLKALDVAAERLWEERREAEEEPEGGPAGPPSGGARPTRVEALLAIADDSLAGCGERNGADRYQVVVHIDEAALGGDGDGACVLEDGPPLAAEAGRRLACDSSVVMFVDGAGAPLRLGRKTRRLSAAQRRAIKARDRGCRFPGCDRTRFLHAHHVQPWGRDGETNLDNLMLLCRSHHRLVHEGGYTVDAAGRFFDNLGHLVPHIPPTAPGRVDGLMAANDELELGPWTNKSGSGERLAFGDVVDALNTAVKRHRGYPRPLLVWRRTQERVIGPMGRPVWPPYGTLRIDTVDENANVLATEVIAENTTPAHACEVALSRSLDYDFDDGDGYVDHHMSVLREPGPCPQPLAARANTPGGARGSA